MVFPVVGGDGKPTGYDIDNSLRFNDDDSAYLRRTFSAGSRTTFTISFWVKRGNISTSNMNLFDAYKDDNNRVFIYFSDNDLKIFGKSAGTTYVNVITDRKFRDPSAWYHIVTAFDTTQATETNRIKVYVNGVQETSFSTYSVLENYATFFNDNTRAHTIGAIGDSGGEDYFYDGYISEINYVDGTQYASSNFGETNNNGVWIPKEADVTFGTNGYYLQFQQTGTSANSSGIGADTSGNDLHLTPNNLAATDITTDTPTNNFATLNPLDSGSGSTFSEGNLATNTDDNKNDIATMGFQNGKWYWETKCAGSGIVGVSHESIMHLNNSNQNDDVGSVAFSTYHGTIFHNTNSDTTPPNDRDGQIIGCAVDMDNDKIYWHVDGTYISTTGGQQDPSGTNGITIKTGTTSDGFYFPKLSSGTTSQTMETNFGNPSFSISSGNSDANGYGNFEYAVPSGYYALCTKNLAEFG
jgi:hypothetical protein